MHSDGQSGTRSKSKKLKSFASHSLVYKLSSYATKLFCLTKFSLERKNEGLSVTQEDAELTLKIDRGYHSQYIKLIPFFLTTSTAVGNTTKPYYFKQQRQSSRSTVVPSDLQSMKGQHRRSYNLEIFRHLSLL